MIGCRFSRVPDSRKLSAVSVASVWKTAVLAIVVLGISHRVLGQDANIRFDEISAQTGIDFVHTDSGTGKHYLYETVASGLATFDYDGDGWIDIYFCNGELPGTKSNRKRLFRNLGNWTFVDVTEKAGLAEISYSLGVVVGDYDNDGDEDLFVNNFGPNMFYCNNGDGTFSKLPNGPSMFDSKLGAGAAFLDIEGDGDLDLWVGNYVKFHYDDKPNRLVFGVPAAPGPKDYAPEPDQLFRNNGDGTFSDISDESGIQSVAGTSMGLIAFDFDQDGDTDMFVCNDSMENFLWQNDGQGRFTEIAELAGVAYDVGGAMQANMGVDCADVNGDGWLDLISTNFDSETTNFYANIRGQYFDELGSTYGLGIASREVKWGVVLSDFDKDSRPDLFIATGHLFDGIAERGSSVKFATKNRLFRNKEEKRFADVSAQAGSGLASENVGRGVACDDLDRDGDSDLVVLNLNRPAIILENKTPTKNSWLKLELIGKQSNRNAVGSLVIVRTSRGEQRQEIHRGRGYQSSYGNSLFFGLADATSIDEIEVRWHGGAKQIIVSPEVNSLLRITEEQ